MQKIITIIAAFLAALFVTVNAGNKVGNANFNQKAAKQINGNLEKRCGLKTKV